jgi:hypothetical protein
MSGPKIRCASCNDVIESTYRHDFVKCKCGKIGIDGGEDYCKTIGDPQDIIFEQQIIDQKKHLYRMLLEKLDTGGCESISESDMNLMYELSRDYDIRECLNPRIKNSDK